MSQKLVDNGAAGVQSGKGHFPWTDERRKDVQEKRDMELKRRLREDVGASGG